MQERRIRRSEGTATKFNYLIDVNVSNDLKRLSGFQQLKFSTNAVEYNPKFTDLQKFPIRTFGDEFNEQIDKVCNFRTISLVVKPFLNDMRSKTIQYYDSSAETKRLQVLVLLQRFLKLNYGDNSQRQSPDDVPKQLNGYDCGVYRVQWLRNRKRRRLDSFH